MVFSKTHYPLLGYSLLAIALAIAPLCSLAQEQTSVSTHFSVLSLDGPINHPLHYDSNNESHKLWLSAITRSPAQSYSGSADLVFYVNTTGPEGEVVPTPVASVNLAAFPQTQVLLLFSKIPGSAERYHIIPVADDPAKSPAYSWKIFNFTDSLIALKVGNDAPKTIPSGNQSAYTFSESTPDGKKIQIAVASDEGWQLERTSIWSHNPNIRSLVFLLPSDKGKPLRVQRVNQPRRNANEH